MIRNYLDYVDDIINSIDEIAEFIEGMDFETFKNDKKTIKAIIRDLEIVWMVCTEEIPPLRPFFIELLNTLSPAF